MTNKLLTILTSVMLSCLCLFTLTACENGDNGGDTPPAHEHSFTNYISDNNATYDSDGTKTAKCDNCDATDTIIDVGSMLIKESITFKTLKVSGNTVYGKVSNTTETFSFINEIKATVTARFIVALDLYGTQEVKTKTIPLEIGDNKVYVTEYVDNEPIRVYTVTVRRRPLYEVTFNSNGGSAVSKQVVEEDSLATEPTTIKTGYTFNGWDYDFSKPITETTTVNANWTANTDTKYTVNYYLQNLEDDNYTLAYSDELKGTTDTTANAEIKEIEHFTAESETVSGNINGNGSTVLKVYYTRNSYTVSSNSSYGSVTNAGTYKYGKNLTLQATENIGCDFLGWYCSNELLSGNATYSLTLSKNVTAKFAVKEEMKDFNFTSTTTTCEVTSVKNNKGTITEIVIPNYVTSIGNYAFEYCFSLTSIVIPDSVTSIGSEAFYDCPIENASIPAIAISSIPKGKLKTVIITNGESIGSKAFYNCDSLMSVTIGNGVTSIGYQAFEGCDSLTSIEIPDSVTSIGNGAFYSCDSLTSVTIGNGVTSIGLSVFRYCSKLTSIVIPDSVTSIGSEAFYDCPIENASIPAIAISSIPKGKLKTVIITNGESIGSEAFYNCDSLMSVTIGNGVTSIGNYAFYSCASLTSVTIGNSVTSIGFSAFEGCNRLTKVNYLGTIDQWVEISFSDYMSNPLYYAENLYINDVLITKAVLTSATKISNYAFRNCSSLTSITIPNSVRSIGNYAFRNCDSLTSIVIPDSVTSIGSNAFQDCPIETASMSAFACDYINKDKLKEVIITSGTIIYNSTFYDCDSLTNVTIGDSVTSIGDYAFFGCKSLTEIVISDSVTSIGDYAFYSCDSLTSIVIPDSVTSIGSDAFSSCDLLTSVTIGNGVTSIGSYAFYNCIKLTSLIFRDTSTWYRTTSSSNWNNKTNGTSTSVTSSSSNATYFKSTYDDYYWYKL